MCEDTVVDDALQALGLSGSTGLVPLRGHSGAAVFALDVGGRRTVLKAVRTPERPDPNREWAFYHGLADRVPVRTPRLLASARTHDLEVLLLQWCQPARPARAWPLTTWLEVARQLGALHAELLDEELESLPWLSHREVDPRRIEARARLWAPHDERAARLFTDLPALVGACSAPPRCLIHGDCHAENLLEEGGLVWIDWQGVGIGHGPEDLALLWQRAEFNGADVPREQMLRAYAAARGIVVDHDLRRAVTAAEIRLLLMGWPSFIFRDPGQPRQLLVDRLGRLGAEWTRSPVVSERGKAPARRSPSEIE